MHTWQFAPSDIYVMGEQFSFPVKFQLKSVLSWMNDSVMLFFQPFYPKTINVE